MYVMLPYHTIPYHTRRYRTRWIYVVLRFWVFYLVGKKKQLCNFVGGGRKCFSAVRCKFLDLLGRVFLSPCPSLSAYSNRMLFKCRLYFFPNLFKYLNNIL